MKAKITLISSPTWFSGGTGLTNFDPNELEFYISVVEGFGDENFVISKLPMTDYLKYNHLYSLHCLDVRQRKSCSPFWDYFWKVEKAVQHFSKKWQITKKIQDSSTKIFDNLLNLSTITMCNMHNTQTNNTQTNNTTMKNAIPSSIVQLLSEDADKIKPAAIKAAAEQIRKQQEEKDARKAFLTLQHLESLINSHVVAVREIRKREKALTDTLKVINAAQGNFLKDGDVAKLNKTLASLNVSQVFL